MSRNDPITVSVDFEYHTEAAVLVRDGDSKVWLPKSQIEEEEDWDTMEVGHALELTIPEWLAEDKGLI